MMDNLKRVCQSDVDSKVTDENSLNEINHAVNAVLLDSSESAANGKCNKLHIPML